MQNVSHISRPASNFGKNLTDSISNLVFPAIDGYSFHSSVPVTTEERYGRQDCVLDCHGRDWTLGNPICHFKPHVGYFRLVATTYSRNHGTLLSARVGGILCGVCWRCNRGVVFAGRWTEHVRQEKVSGRNLDAQTTGRVWSSRRGLHQQMTLAWQNILALDTIIGQGLELARAEGLWQDESWQRIFTGPEGVGNSEVVRFWTSSFMIFDSAGASIRYSVAAGDPQCACCGRRAMIPATHQWQSTRSKPLVLAVTVLTSMDADDLADIGRWPLCGSGQASGGACAEVGLTGLSVRQVDPCAISVGRHSNF